MLKNDNPKSVLGVFANQGEANTIPLQPSTSDPQLANYQTGFPSITQQPVVEGGIPPERTDFNGLFQLMSSHNFFVQNGGSYTYNPDVASAIGGYAEGALLWYVTPTAVRLLRSTKGNNTDNFVLNPSVIGASWVDAILTTAIADSKFVTTNTVQTITGSKTFNAALNVNSTLDYADVLRAKMTDYDLVNGPFSAKQRYVALLDKNNKFGGYVSLGVNEQGATSSTLSARLNKSDGSNTTASINVSIKRDGTVSTYAPTPSATASTTNTNIATVGWVNNPDLSTNVIHRTGDETKDGMLGFAVAKGINFGKGTNTSASITARSSGTPLTGGGMFFLYDNDINKIMLSLAADGSYVQLGSNFCKDIRAVTPDDNDYSTRVATTTFVKNQGYIKQSQGVAFGIKLSNGQVFNWGTVPTGSSQTVITYPIPFDSSDSYRCVGTPNWNNQNGTVSQTGQTATGTTFYHNSGIGIYWIAIGY